MGNPLQFPNIAPATERLTIDRRQAGMESTSTKALQVINTAATWQLQWTWPVMPYRSAVRINAWIASLAGLTGTFIYRPRQPYVTASLTGRTLASTGFKYLNTILVGGWNARVDSDLFSGQYMQIGEQLLMITAASATADANGRVTIEFQPQLRAGYAIGSPVNLANPAGLFRLAEASGQGFTLDPDRLPSFGTIGAMEVV